jgi:hypothetical protein
MAEKRVLEIEDAAATLESQRQEKRSLDEKRKATQQAGNHTRTARMTLKEAREARHRFENANKSVVDFSVLTLVAAAIAVGVIPAVFLVDVAIFSASADYLSRLAFPDNDVVANIARVLIPGVVLALDYWIGSHVWQARQAARREPTLGGDYRRWLFVASLFVILMPVFAGTAAIAAVLSAADGSLRQLLSGEGIAATIFALVAHSGIILGSKAINDGFAYMVLRVTLWGFKAKEVTYGSAATLNENRCVELFQDYWTALEAYNREFDEQERPCPFDEFTAELINSRMGRRLVEVVEEADAKVRS